MKIIIRGIYYGLIKYYISNKRLRHPQFGILINENKCLYMEGTSDIEYLDKKKKKYHVLRHGKKKYLPKDNTALIIRNIRYKKPKGGYRGKINRIDYLEILMKLYENKNINKDILSDDERYELIRNYLMYTIDFYYFQKNDEIRKSEFTAMREILNLDKNKWFKEIWNEVENEWRKKIQDNKAEWPIVYIEVKKPPYNFGFNI